LIGISAISFNFAHPGYSFYEDLLSEGIVALYDIIDEYVKTYKEVFSVSFEDYVVRELGVCFGALRRARNSEYYRNISFNKQIREGKGATLGDFISKGKYNPEKTLATAPAPEFLAINAVDFIGIKPKLLVKEGDRVKIGQPVFFPKALPEVRFCSPAGGIVKEIRRCRPQKQCKHGKNLAG